MTSYPRLFPVLTSPAKIGDLEIDVVMSRQVDFTSEVTSNPVEDGFAVQDHIKRNSIPLKVTAIFTPTPVTWGTTNVNRLQDVTAALQKIYMAGETITVTMPDAIYTNMVMTSAPIKRDSTGLYNSIDLSFVQVRKVAKKTAATDDSDSSAEASEKTGATGQDAGTANQTDIGTGVKTVSNTDTIEVDTSFLDYSASGSISTGLEQTAVTAARELIASFVASAGVKLGL